MCIAKFFATNNVGPLPVECAFPIVGFGVRYASSTAETDGATVYVGKGLLAPPNRVGRCVWRLTDKRRRSADNV
jgi:hypothetical protein